MPIRFIRRHVVINALNRKEFRHRSCVAIQAQRTWRGFELDVLFAAVSFAFKTERIESAGQRSSFMNSAGYAVERDASAVVTESEDRTPAYRVPLNRLARGYPGSARHPHHIIRRQRDYLVAATPTALIAGVRETAISTHFQKWSLFSASWR
jgi:hypothetical protein